MLFICPFCFLSDQSVPRCGMGGYYLVTTYGLQRMSQRVQHKKSWILPNGIHAALCNFWFRSDEPGSSVTYGERWLERHQFWCHCYHLHQCIGWCHQFWQDLHKTSESGGKSQITCNASWTWLWRRNIYPQILIYLYPYSECPLPLPLWIVNCDDDYWIISSYHVRKLKSCHSCSWFVLVM